MFRGNGPIGQITAVADGQGQVRGFVGNPTANPDLKNGKVRIYSILVLKYLRLCTSIRAWTGHR